jgi:hypothetical protein
VIARESPLPPNLALAADRVRRLVGFGCVVVAFVTFGLEAVPSYRHFESAYQADAWRTPLDRQTATGDILGLDREYQLRALALIPRTATFAVLPPPSPAVAAQAYGINSITFNALPGFFLYWLLPAREVAPEKARYILCYGCDTTPWTHRTTWLFTNTHGDLIGRVNKR